MKTCLLQQEDIPVLGGQEAHFNSMVGMKMVQLGQQSHSGLTTGGVKDSSQQDMLGRSGKAQLELCSVPQLALAFSGKGKDEKINTTWMG